MADELRDITAKRDPGGLDRHVRTRAYGTNVGLSQRRSVVDHPQPSLQFLSATLDFSGLIFRQTSAMTSSMPTSFVGAVFLSSLLA